VTSTTGSIITVTLNPAVDKTLEVPGFQLGAHAQAELKALVPAGKGVNVARGIVRLGGRAAACAFIGRDEERMFAERLSAEGVEARFCVVAGRTRTNTTVLDPEAHTTTHLRERGFEVGAEDVRALRMALTDWLAERREATAVFAGSLPPAMSPADFGALIGACASRGARVFVDTSGPALQAALETRLVDALKPNLLELGECLGGAVERSEAPRAAERLLDRVGTVLLTLGAEGAFVIRRGLTVGRRCPVPGREVRNTVGCGDAFLAGWLRGEQLCDDPAEALCWAVAAGAASAVSETTVGYALADVEALLPRCEPVG
jgi:1-phosphofructokinase